MILCENSKRDFGKHQQEEDIMSEERKRRTIVIGHKNPDTDSICSAICYAALKSKITGNEYVAGRAGHVNEETQYVLNYFHVEAPQLIKKQLDVQKERQSDRREAK